MARVGLYADAPEAAVRRRLRGGGHGRRGRRGRRRGSRSGERVMAGTRFGGYASQVVVPTGDVVALPERLSFEQGAAVPVVYATAWAALLRLRLAARRRARARPRRRRRRRHRRACSSPSAAAPRSTARRRPASTTRCASSASTARIDYRSDGWWRDLPQLRPRHRRHRRRVVQALLRAAAARRAARRARRLVGPGGRDAQPAPRAAPGAADDARLRPDQADERLEGRSSAST